MSDHAGTHVDAPCHFNPDPTAQSIDQVPLASFYTEAICLDLSHVPLKHQITVREMEEALAKSGQEIKPRDTVLINMGVNKRLFGTPGYVTDFPGLDVDSVHWLADRKVPMFGVEAVSPAPQGEPNFKAHLACAQRGITHIECLWDLEAVVGKGRFRFIAFPLRIRGGTASPIRAVAVLAVIAYHANAKLAPGGFVGVDVFFVISGFLISSIIFKNLERGSFTFANFYARRIRRIFPALSVVLAAVLAAGWLTLLPDAYGQLGRHVAAGAGFLSNIVFWREAGYFDKAAEQKPLLHLWSLGVEEQFYLLWPVVMVICSNIGLNLLVVVVSVAAGSFLLLNVMAVHTMPAAVFPPAGHAFVGAADRQRALRVCGRCALTGRDMISRGLSWYDHGRAFRDAESGLGALSHRVVRRSDSPAGVSAGWWALLPTVGTFLLISAGMQARINRHVPVSRRWCSSDSSAIRCIGTGRCCHLRSSVGDPPGASGHRGGGRGIPARVGDLSLLELPVRSGASWGRPPGDGLSASLAIVALAGV